MYQFYLKSKAQGLLRSHQTGRSIRALPLLLLIILLSSARVFAQNVTLTEKNAPLKKVFLDINKQTGLDFLASGSVMELARTVTITVKEQPVKTVLDEIFQNQPLQYEIQEKIVAVSRKPISGALEKPPVNFIEIKGKIVDSLDNPLPGAKVKNLSTGGSLSADQQGFFSIPANIGDEILISYVGYEPQKVKVQKSNLDLTIHLIPVSSKLDEVSVVSTGYQIVPKERETGSFTIVDNKTIERSVSFDLLTRLNGVTNGLLIDQSTGNPTGISIRGRSTLFSNTEPLIVIDNFPYEGDINSINPNDVATVTVLKDAAAASIWGVRAGNGVIVITTKKGKVSEKPIININSNLTVGDKPNLNYRPQLSSSEFIDIEKYLFAQGAYYQLGDDFELISPVIAILNQQQQGLITQSQVDQQLNALKNIDDRGQLSKYFYRKSVTQQYSLNVSGGSTKNTYYISGGYDSTLPNQVALSNSRITLKANNTFRLLNDRLTFSTDVNFTKSKSVNNNAQGYNPKYPYEQVADGNGNPLTVLGVGGSGTPLRASYTDTAGNGKLLNWKYQPLVELRNKTSTQSTDQNDYRILLGLNYKIIPSLSLSINYQYENINTQGALDYNQNSFYVRDLVNSYSQIDPVLGTVSTPIPLGDIYTPSRTNYQANYGRGQLNFNQQIGTKNEINAIAGYEVRAEQSQFISSTLYGYNPSIETSAVIDPTTNFPSYYAGGAYLFRLGNTNFLNSSENRYFSYYGNASYSYDQRYILTGSYRKDESNLFGVKANQKGVPLWSTGLAWNIANEKFFKRDWLSELKLKATYGYNGNVNQNVSAYLTAQPAGLNPVYSNNNYSTIVNPPNDALKWERVKNLNFGVDFSSKSNRISGSVEYYIKDGLDLIGVSPIAPQEGVSTFTGNTANTHASGLDLQINTNNLTGPFKWMTSFIFNHVIDKVTTYDAPRSSNLAYLSQSAGFTPIEDYPINSLFGFKYLGLDNTGSPVGVLNGAKSQTYGGILNSSTISDLSFFGSAVPTTYGSLRNTFSYRSLELSFNILYKLNYYFRRPSLNNTQLYNGNFQQPDYNNRWQKPGDELSTNVPALIYPVNTSRDALYQYSSVLVTRADHIRLQDIQLNYTFTKSKFIWLPFTSLNLYLYANNIGILWRANKQGLDPDAVAGYPVPRTLSFGIKANL